MRGGSQKVTNDDEGEGGVTIPPKIDDVIYEQPLTNKQKKSTGSEAAKIGKFSEDISDILLRQVITS